MKKVLWYLKCLLGFGSIHDGSVCWFSEAYFDVHDYPVHKGGNGYPMHFYDYTCSRCGRRFLI